MDVLSDLLRNFRFNGSLYFRSSLAQPWGMQISEGGPGLFHYIEQGEAWLRSTDKDPPQRLGKGDFVVFPAGGKHWIASDKNAPLLDSKLVVGTINSANPPFKKSPSYTTLICGYFDFNTNINHPFIKSLPKFIYITYREMQNTNFLENVIKLIQLESIKYDLGAHLMIDRLTEILFVQVLRTYQSKMKIKKGYLSALNDNFISRAIGLIHEHPEIHWTVEKLAQKTGMSRSAFAERFHQLVEIPPKSYLIQWRMHLAAQKLKETDLQMYEIAEKSGYTTEASFNKAFKKHFNISPGKFRKQE